MLLKQLHSTIGGILATYLHEIEVLVHLATESDATISKWAQRLLALRAPHKVRFEDASIEARNLLIVTSSDAVQQAFECLKSENTHPEPALHIALQLARFPPDTKAAIACIHDAIEQGNTHPILLQWLMALDALTTKNFAPFATEESFQVALAALHLAHKSNQLGSVVDQLASFVASKLNDGTLTEADLLDALHCPILELENVQTEEEAAEHGAFVARSAQATSVNAKGSQKRRIQKWIRALLKNTTDKRALLLASLSTKTDNLGFHSVAASAWLAGLDPNLKAIESALLQSRSEPAILNQARLTYTSEEHRKAWQTALDSPIHNNVSAVVVLDNLQDISSLEVANLWRIPEKLFLSDGLAAVAIHTYNRCPDRIAEWITEFKWRDLLLSITVVCTEELLLTLIKMPVPVDLAPQDHYLRALAEYADPAAFEHLKAVIEHLREPEQQRAAPIFAHACALLGR